MANNTIIPECVTMVDMEELGWPVQSTKFNKFEMNVNANCTSGLLT